jgi:hypothetical protein
MLQCQISKCTNVLVESSGYKPLQDPSQTRQQQVCHLSCTKRMTSSRENSACFLHDRCSTFQCRNQSAHVPKSHVRLKSVGNNIIRYCALGSVHTVRRVLLAPNLFWRRMKQVPQENKPPTLLYYNLPHYMAMMKT